jgi:hypothetical protein
MAPPRTAADRARLREQALPAVVVRVLVGPGVRAAAATGGRVVRVAAAVVVVVLAVRGEVIDNHYPARMTAACSRSPSEKCALLSLFTLLCRLRLELLPCAPLSS